MTSWETGETMALGWCKRGGGKPSVYGRFLCVHRATSVQPERGAGQAAVSIERDPGLLDQLGVLGQLAAEKRGSSLRASWGWMSLPCRAIASFTSGELKAATKASWNA
jgi:hypothetical protein